MITLSAGHWKVGTGAVGFIDEVIEARRVVKELKSHLIQLNVTVHSVFDDVSTNQRENLTYLVSKHNETVRNLDVSIHFNATSETTQNAIGCEVLYVNDKLQQLARELCCTIHEASGLLNRGAKKRTDLYFLNQTKAPALLIEVCFVNSKQDVKLYNEHFDKICRAVTKTLANYVKPNSVTSQFSSASLQNMVTTIVRDEAFVQQFLKRGATKQAFQKGWVEKFQNEKVTSQDICGLALLYVYKTFS